MLQLAQMPGAYTLLAGLGWARTSKALDLYGPDLMPNRINVSKSASLTWACRPLIPLNAFCAPALSTDSPALIGRFRGRSRAPLFTERALQAARAERPHCMPSASLYMSRTASSSAMSSGSRLRNAMTLRITLVS